MGLKQILDLRTILSPMLGLAKTMDDSDLGKLLLMVLSTDMSRETASMGVAEFNSINNYIINNASESVTGCLQQCLLGQSGANQRSVLTVTSARVCKCK
ncbi:hypothetical protein DID80_00810 [Candidatus Marinamargulisbacteria bacterium SCGC AAA071-K20]|nr:hypothetical protein DID80_00810 [Candidatus Marinamargulisbacteria bacterium SCGC AAA071-K20]